MHIAGLQKLTLLDYPGKTAVTVFTPGCNFCCPFCHNADLVTGQQAHGGDAVSTVSLDEFFSFLVKRQGLLDGVCITGGEPLLQHNLAEFCERIHSLGYAVKLDTNGSFPENLRDLVERGFVDFVAMDVKNAPEHYADTIGIPGFDLAPVRTSIEYLLSGPVPFEFRTTITRELHTSNDLLGIARWIGSAPAWFLQSYIDAESVIAGPGNFHAWTPDDLHALLPELQALVPQARLRGVD